MRSDRRRIRVLFVALAQSTHSHAWITLLDPMEFDVRVFGVQGTRVPDGLPIKMVPMPQPPRRVQRVLRRLARLQPITPDQQTEQALVKFVSDWNPDIVHSLGLDPASYFYLKLRRRHPILERAAWVVTARGGPELALGRLLSGEAARIKAVLEGCTQFIADNDLNYRYAVALGLAPEKKAPFGRMPGAGGIDIPMLREARLAPVSTSRIVVMPKAYECPASKVLPVFEALKLCWAEIQPCEVHFTAVTPEAEMWFSTLPAEIQNGCRLYHRISPRELFALMGRSRVMLAPSLTDGVPNVLYESMASGCLPIVSPIETLTPLVEENINVLFARNLYPDEIAHALVRAMRDDVLVDAAAERNLELVGKLADRQKIRPVVAENYRRLSEGRPS